MKKYAFSFKVDFKQILVACVTHLYCTQWTDVTFWLDFMPTGRGGRFEDATLGFSVRPGGEKQNLYRYV